MTALQTIRNTGERLDFEQRQGSTWGPFTRTLTNPDGTPVDLTGVTLRGQIRKTALATTLQVAITFELAPDPTEGWYRFWVPAADTEAFDVAEEIGDDDSRYRYDIEYVDASGRVIPDLWGYIRFQAEVTRPVTP